MIYRTVVATLLLSALVLAQTEEPKSSNRGGPHGGPHGGHRGGPPPPPPFLKNASAEARKAFFEIVKTQNLTVAETSTKLGAWAKTYGLTEQFNAHEAKIAAHWAEVRKNRTEVIGNLAAVQKQIQAIFANKDQTKKAQYEALNKLEKEYPKEVETLFFITRDSKPPGAEGGRDFRGGEQRQHGQKKAEGKKGSKKQ